MSNHVAELLQQLAGKNRQVREEAARALGEVGDQQAVPQLIQALGDKYAKVREAAAWALGRVGDERAVPHLVRAFGDPSMWVRSEAVKALGQIGPAAVPHVVQALDDERWEVRELAASALGRIGDQSALPHLVQALSDSKDAVRTAAASALGQLGDQRAVPHLVQALDSKGKSHWWAGQALGRLGALPELVQALDDKRSWVREGAVRGLSEIGEEGIPHLVRALDDASKQVRKRAASILGQRRDKRAIPYLFQVVKDPDVHDWERRIAAQYLGQLGYQLPVPVEAMVTDLNTAVLRRISRDFPPEDREYVIEQLKRYRGDSLKRRKRVHLAILKLSEGSKGKVANLVEVALRDYRDILLWVERASQKTRKSKTK
ncbi:MAG TPA: HEAT repeat domain-containing protein [Anaerolineae bacterium]|nr:HEAT repeat domain-containing protein [Anaerolineae bacterium]